MSKTRVKTTYKTEGPYGSEETHTLYAVHNHSTDYVTFYDENEEYLFTVEDTRDNNFLDAINRLYVYWEGKSSDGILKEGVEYWKKE